MPTFTHLHVHTEYSLADASLKIKELAKKVKEYGMDSIAITDHGQMFGAVEFYKACVAEGIKPIIGMEAYVAPRSNTLKEAHTDDANYHLVLLAENNNGYSNLIQIASDAAINGFYYKPRTDKHKLRQWGKNIIALSACLGGEVQEFLMEDKYEDAKVAALQYNEIFGQGNFYLELQDHKMPEQAMVNTKLLRLSRETGIPLICTNDCHYLNKDGAKPHDVLMAIQAKTTVDDTKRKVYPSDQFYLKTPHEMYQLFSYVPEAIENTVRVAARCNVTMEFGKNKLPHFDVPEGFTNKDYLTKLVYEGAAELYGDLTVEIEERIQYEISTVDRMGYIDYFLIVWDFIRYARERGILTGPGRGSGAGSILLYCLKVTKIDPLKYNLLFERFLDPSRVSMPDVDLDYPDDRRQEVIEYVIEKYGQKSICQIITFGTMAARGAIRAVGRALDYPYSVQDTTAKMVPAELGITIRDALKMNPDLKIKYDNDQKIQVLLDTAMQLEGLPIYTSTHAAGVLITDSKGVNAHVPTWQNDSAVVSQFAMGNLEELGLLKMDFLGLKTLTVLSRAAQHIKNNYGVKVDFDTMYRCEDLKPLELIKRGHTQGIFQLEGTGMTQFMMEFAPTSLEEVIAGISLYRPGPMQYIPTFLSNRRNPDNISYRFEELRPILQETYGILTYQEQCMRTVIALGGYQKHHSDSFRKAIAKKKADLIAIHRQWFIDGRPEIEGKQDAIPGAVAMGFSRAELEKLYSEMEEFGKYAFNKSHAAAYAVIAYCTMWLKYYYPAEFMAALMDSVQKSKKRVAWYIRHCNDDLGITIEPPDINLSTEYFMPLPNKKIIFSLSAKNTSVEALAFLNDVRSDKPIKSVKDFLSRCHETVNKQTYEALISIGAFNSLGVVRSQYIAAMNDIMDKLNKVKAAKRRFMANARRVAKEEFNFLDRFDIDEMIPEISEFPNEVLLRIEKRYLGLYLSGHPLHKYLYMIQSNSNFKTSDIDFEMDEDTGEVQMLGTARNYQHVKFIGLISNIKELYTKADKKPMATVEVEDLEGSCRMVIFPDVYKKVKDVLQEDEVLQIRGSLSIKPDEPPSIFCEGIEPIESTMVKRLIVDVKNHDEVLELVSHIGNLRVPGSSPVYARTDKMQILLQRPCWVDIDMFLHYFDRNIISEDRIEIKEW